MFDRCIYFNVNVLARTINTIWDDAFKKAGLSPAHAYILRFVNAHPGTNQRDIAEELFIDKSTVTRFIDPLCQKGYIERIQHADDRRVFEIYPTKAGEKLALELEVIADELFHNMQKKLGKADFKEFVSCVKGIATTLKN